MSVGKDDKMGDGGVVALQDVLEVHKFEGAIHIHRHKADVSQRIAHEVEAVLVFEDLEILDNHSRDYLLEFVNAFSKYPGADRPVEGVDRSIEMLHELPTDLFRKGAVLVGVFCG
jgi:hypothetical protein